MQNSDFQHDRAVLRPMAARWMELATLPVMAARRRQWTALKDLKPERPMVLFETWSLEHWVTEAELECRTPLLRETESLLRRYLRHAQELGDDLTLEPEWRLPWVTDVEYPDYGVDLTLTRIEDGAGGQEGYTVNHPIHTVADIDRLHPRSWRVDRPASLRRVETLQEVFGDILPVRLHGTEIVQLHAGLTNDLFKLLGNDILLRWVYDEPEAIHRLMAFLRDDRLAYHRFLEQEGLLGLNTDYDIRGWCTPGFTTQLPQPDYVGTVRLRDVWGHTESQETTMISPRMFGQFFLPYMAEVCKPFGLMYYGCCEPVHDRFALIRKAIPQLRGVSISPWCDQRAIAAQLGREVVFSRKPKPWFISGDNPDWDSLEKDLDETLAAARDCALEFIFRDVYRINHDSARVRRWVSMVRARVGGEMI